MKTLTIAKASLGCQMMSQQARMSFQSSITMVYVKTCLHIEDIWTSVPFFCEAEVKKSALSGLMGTASDL